MKISLYFTTLMMSKNIQSVLEVNKKEQVTGEFTQSGMSLVHDKLQVDEIFINLYNCLSHIRKQQTDTNNE